MVCMFFAGWHACMAWIALNDRNPGWFVFFLAVTVACATAAAFIG